MKRLQRGALGITGLLLALSCKTTEPEEQRTRIPPKKVSSTSCDPVTKKVGASLTATDEVTYEDDIKQVIAKSCTTGVCHPNYKTYTVVKTNGKAIVSSIIADNMPPVRKLTTVEKKLFTDWQSNGYAEKAAPVTVPQTTADDDTAETTEKPDTSPTVPKTKTTTTNGTCKT
jgi:hypothetical protein